jgi:biopolymer transport protein ExbD
MDARPVDDGIMAEINITPFTDVLLVLLIVFMLLAALVAPPGFEQQSGGGDGRSRAPAVPPIAILVDAGGGVWVAGVRVGERGLYRALSDAAVRRGRALVAIAADVGAPYGIVLRVLDAAKLAGLRDVGFVTR